MIDEGLTNVLKRRIFASLVDLGIVGGLTTIFARSQSERFAIVERTADGSAAFAPADATRLEAIARGFNRTQEFGDTLFAFELIDLIFIAVVGALLTLLAKVLIPANTGWSVGQKLFGLRVVDDQGQRPTTAQHFARTAGATLDLAPWVIPGLLGWVLARRRPFNQRIGDSSAKTAVIGTRASDGLTDPSSTSSPAMAALDEPQFDDVPARQPTIDRPDPALTEQPPAPATLSEAPTAAAPPAPSAPPVETVEPVADLPGVGAPLATSPTEPATASTGEPSLAERLQHAANASPIPAASPTPNLQPGRVPPVGSDSSMEASRLDADVAPEPLSEPPQTERLNLSGMQAPSFNLPDIDTTPTAAAAPPATAPPDPEPATVDPEPEPDPEPATIDPEPEPTPVLPSLQPRADRPAPMHRTAAERDDLFRATSSPSPTPVPQATTAPDTDRKKPPPPRHRAVRTDWDRPVAEPAPVWGADHMKAATAPEPDLDLTAPEHTRSAPATDPAAATAPTAETESAAQAAASVAAVASSSAPQGSSEAKEPQWSEEWDSWLYWDATRVCWLRHDTNTGKWVPIE